MKCLSLMQPWASLIVLGGKQYETRRWQTEYRGVIAVHACRRFPEAARALCAAEPFHSILLAAGIKQSADLPCGAILGTVELVACLPADEVLPRTASAADIAYGDSRAVRWAWQLARPAALASPLPYVGQRGLFEIPDLARIDRCKPRLSFQQHAPGESR